jgi:syntaxin-binding protein 1
MCKQLAMMLQKEMDRFKTTGDTYPEINDHKRAVLLIVDRSFDMMAPFLHEFTYQAMMQDLICGEKTKLP